MIDTLMPLDHQNKLSHILLNHPYLTAILQQLYEIEPDAYIAAGVIRNTIWDYLHDRQYDLNHTEVDIVFYDPDDDGRQHQKIEDKITKIFPSIQWDVTNQALVHQWYRTEEGASISALQSLAHAISLWPETATAVAVRFNHQGNIDCLAPLGLADLLHLKLRWNPALVAYSVFLQRIQQKKFLSRWPKLSCVDI
ncbi:MULTISPECIES: nucleotidyltransferase family protein [unclassified Acinetobacter]|uniref:nucleotidyltransferase family protein n=1 Tax=unclassified Acinetobacter TaxID=196816 RepID=UPI0029348302|nr:MULTISPECIES: nucleotidyltransferase family protein [unclassified Acinetobacter]WOE30848.1 nucleotidyltransferase family protein [Acinetobacter sp. SAAs470]WOE39043.1 nucleotidyltransferase family protein [Acinetobacter sp. SAAs474]